MFRETHTTDIHAYDSIRYLRFILYNLYIFISFYKYIFICIYTLAILNRLYVRYNLISLYLPLYRWFSLIIYYIMYRCVASAVHPLRHYLYIYDDVLLRPLYSHLLPLGLIPSGRLSPFL